MTRAAARPMGPDEVRDRTGVSRETVERLAAIVDLLRDWQRRINLVAPSTLADPWRRHVLDSLQLAPLIPPTARTVLDLGSGAGFPGLVLSVATGCDFHLVEADTRKAAFLREAARCADSRAIVHPVRIERLSGLVADVVTARALAPLPKLLNYCSPFLNPAGRGLFLKGRTVRSELTGVPDCWKLRVRLLGSAADPEGAVLVIEGAPDA